MTTTRSTALATALALLAACSSDPAPDTRPAGPLPRADNWDGIHRVSLRYYQGPACGGASSVVADGPGPGAPEFATTTVHLACSGGTWSADLVLGADHPDAPTRYVFTVTDGGAPRQADGFVPCYVDTLAVPLTPTAGSTVPSPVTFTWARAGAFPEASSEYTVYVDGPEPVPRKSVVDQPSLSFALAARSYPGWSVEVIGVGGWEPASPVRCSGRKASGAPFTVPMP